MKSIDTLMDIHAMINSEGGVNFIKIKMLLCDIDDLADQENPKALQFIKELENVHAVVLAATQMELVKK